MLRLARPLAGTALAGTAAACCARAYDPVYFDARLAAGARIGRATVAVGRVVAAYKAAPPASESADALSAAQEAQEAAGVAIEKARLRGDAAAARVAEAAARDARAAVRAAAPAASSSARSALHRECAEVFLECCRANGGVYVKLAQHAAMLEHLLPPEYTETFKCMLAAAPVSSPADVAAVVAEELGQPPDEYFAAFDPVPVASASLAQVHEATLRSGERVAVKVQHRGLREAAAGDIWAVRRLTEVAALVFPDDFSLSWLADELALNLPLELDFCHEADNAARARDHFARQRARGELAVDVHVPHVYRGATTHRVLTMEFADGVSAGDAAAVDRLGLSRAEVARSVYAIFNAQIFGSGFVHCDPHAANVLVTRGRGKNAARPRLVLLDHGLYRELDDAFRITYAGLWQSIALADAPAIEKHCRALNAGAMYPLLAAMITQRPWDEVTTPALRRSRAAAAKDAAPPSAAEKKAKDAMLQHYAKRYLPEIGAMMQRVPRALLLVFKTNDCLRGIGHSLGAPPVADVATAVAAADAMRRERRSTWGDHKKVRLRLWAAARMAER